jgi:hypothetical protein
MTKGFFLLCLPNQPFEGVMSHGTGTIAQKLCHGPSSLGIYPPAAAFLWRTRSYTQSKRHEDSIFAFRVAMPVPFVMLPRTPWNVPF